MSLKHTLTALMLVTFASSLSLAADYKGAYQLMTPANNPAPTKRAKYTVPQSSGDYNKRVDALAQEATNYQEQLEKDKAAVTASQQSLIDDLSAAEAELASAETKYDKSKKYFGKKYSGLDKLKADIDSAKAKRDKALELRNKIKENEKAVQTTTDNIDAVNDEAKRIGADFADIQKGLHTQLKLNGITMEYAKLNKFFDNNDNRLEAIANYYDKTVLGAYVQDKITELARSNVMCDSIKNCMADNNKKVSAEDVEAELFGDSRSSRKHNQPSLKSTQNRGIGFASPIPASTEAK